MKVKEKCFIEPKDHFLPKIAICMIDGCNIVVDTDNDYYCSQHAADYNDYLASRTYDS